MKKLIKAVVVIGLLGLSAGANALNVGGVEWTPGVPSGGADKDTTWRFEFNQWFTTGANAAPDGGALNPANAINSTTATLGDVLQGVGEIYKFNGSNVLTNSLTGGAVGSFCNGCELTFAFGGFTVSGATSFSGGWLNLYVDSTPEFNVSDNPFAAANANRAIDGTPWLSLLVDESVFTTFTSFDSGSLSAYYHVTGGLAKDYFDTNSWGNTFLSDFLQSASATFNLNQDGSRQVIATSTGQMFGESQSVPEPEYLALIGIALLGFAAARRKA